MDEPQFINLPSKIVSGKPVKFTVSLDDYSPAEWTLSYHLRGAVARDVTGTTSDDGLSFKFDFVAETSGMTPVPLTPGQYFFQSYATNVSTSSDKRLVDSGRFEVLTDLSNPSLTSYDGRTENEKIWAAIKAMIAKKATRDQMSYTIGQRTISRIPMDQLIMFEQHYAKKVAADRARERMDNGGSFFETIKTQFREPQ